MNLHIIKSTSELVKKTKKKTMNELMDNTTLQNLVA